MRTLTRSAMLAAFVALFPLLPIAAQDEKKTDLNVGERAPAFESKDAAGLTWKSADHLGKKYIVVYF